MDPDYEETMAELHGEACIPTPNAMMPPVRVMSDGLPYTITLTGETTVSLDDQLAIVLPRIGTAFETLAGWLLAGSIVGHVRDMVEPGLRDGYEVYRDDSFRLSQYELAVEAMEEIRDAIIYIAIMLEKEERGVEK